MNSLFTAGYIKGREHERTLILKDIQIELYKAQIDGDVYGVAALQALLTKLENNGDVASE